ncbi:MAG: hypothetical protein P8Y45_18430 [Exilibacterium sp.]
MWITATWIHGLTAISKPNPRDRFLVRWTPDLRAITEEILKTHPPRIGNRPLFFARRYRPYIDADGNTNGFDSIWGRYMRKAVAQGLCERFREHDLRAKAVERETLEAASRYLRHTSPAVTTKHYRNRPEEI